MWTGREREREREREGPERGGRERGMGWGKGGSERERGQLALLGRRRRRYKEAEREERYIHLVNNSNDAYLRYHSMSLFMLHAPEFPHGINKVFIYLSISIHIYISHL